MAPHVLAGDVGGTKIALAVYEVAAPGALTLVREATFRSRSFPNLEAAVTEFLAAGTHRIAAGAFGIPGPVFDDVAVTTNLPWRVEAASLARLLGCEHVRLMNDLETTAYGALFLPPAALHTLNAGVARRGTIAVIAAGTGLGQAFLFWDGTRHRATATEGGHVDFAPRDEKEIALLTHLQRRYGHVSFERAVSGPGLVNTLGFLTDVLGRPVAPPIRERLAVEDPAVVIGEAGLAGTCPTCAEAVDMLIDLYGAQAGNLALTVMATGGVFIGGGIVTKLLPKVAAGPFMQAFTAKGRYEQLMREIPVRVILDPTASRLGAGHAAADLLG